MIMLKYGIVVVIMMDGFSIPYSARVKCGAKQQKWSKTTKGRSNKQAIQMWTRALGMLAKSQV
jgi:hypothetical protein